MRGRRYVDAEVDVEYMMAFTDIAFAIPQHNILFINLLGIHGKETKIVGIWESFIYTIHTIVNNLLIYNMILSPERKFGIGLGVVEAKSEWKLSRPSHSPRKQRFQAYRTLHCYAVKQTFQKTSPYGGTRVGSKMELKCTRGTERNKSSLLQIVSSRSRKQGIGTRIYFEIVVLAHNTSGVSMNLGKRVT